MPPLRIPVDLSRGVVNHNLIKPNLKIPPLENGDQLTRPEFERRYQKMPKLKKAELIATVQEGIVSLEHQNFLRRLSNLR